MSDKLWSLVVDIKIAERYYWHYINLSKRYDYVLSGLCLFASAASISAWYIWAKVPVLWAIILGAAQVVSTFKPLFPFARRMDAATYVQQDISALFIDIESEWGRCTEEVSRRQVAKLCAEYSRRLQQIEDRFAPPGLFPQNAKLHHLAQKEAQIYFLSHYNYQSSVEGGV